MTENEKSRPAAWANVLRVVICGAILLGALRASADLPVVEKGQARAVIVRNTEGGKVVALAANELRDHIAAITGVKLPVVSAAAWDRASGQTALIVGQGDLLKELGADLGELPREGFRILPLPERHALILAGRDNGDPLSAASSYRRDQEFGSLYAVYELLEHWGVRWLFAGELGTIIPKAETLAAPLLDKVDGPDFIMRNLWPIAVTADGVPASRADLSGKDAKKKAAAEAVHMWALRNRAGNSTDKYRGGHHSPRWWDLWSETHPEYLGLYRGQRGIRRSPPGAMPDQMPARSKICAGNPKVAEAVADLAIKAFRASENCRSYSICEQDGSPGFCDCSLCTGLDAPVDGNSSNTSLPSLTDRYMVFWNRVAERVAKEFPDRQIGMYLYSRYEDLPRREQSLHPRLRAIYVNNGQVEPNELKRRIKGWAKLSPNPIGLYIPPMFGAWPLLDFSSASFPVMTLGNVHNGLLFCREQRVVGFVGDAGNFANNNVGSHGVLGYAYMRWLWDADRAPADVLDDFTRHAFGPAAETMRAYFSEIERRQNAFPRADGPGPWMEHNLQAFTPAFVSDLMVRLDKASALAQTDGDRKRVQLFRQNLAYTAAELDLERAWRLFEKQGGAIEPVLAAHRACEKLYGELWPENRPQQPLFRSGDAARAAAMADHYNVMRVLDSSAWEMRADPYGEGMAQHWYKPGSEGDWRPVVMGGYDLQGLQGSDVRVWYRTRFEAPAGVPAQKLRLGFRVHNTSADLFLNGERLGQQVLGEAVFKEPELDGEGNLVSGQAMAGNAPFVYDIGRQVRPGQTNELAVRIWGYTDRGVLCQKTWLLQERPETAKK